MKECHIDDDGGSIVIAIEAPDSSGHRQSLWFRVGMVFYGDDVADEPGVWVEYQEEHNSSSMAGPILITPEVWKQLSHAVNHRISRYAKWRRYARRVRLWWALMRTIPRKKIRRST